MILLIRHRQAAELALDRFEQAWGARYPMSVASWRKHWDGLTAFFKYPVEFRRLIYTTNAIESLNSQMRKNIATRKVVHGEFQIGLNSPILEASVQSLNRMPAHVR